jgi:hypothetical protein
MVKGQLKKLFYDKKLVDSRDGDAIAEWRLSTGKVFFMLLGIMVSLIVVYCIFFTGDPNKSIGDFVFNSVIVVGVIAVIWIIGNIVYKSRTFVAGFIIGFILIISLYWFLSVLFSYFGLFDFHFGGLSLWVLLSVLSALGARKIDGHLTKEDVFFGCLVLLVLFGANLPLFDSHGFLWKMDNLIDSIFGLSNSLGL